MHHGHLLSLQEVPHPPAVRAAITRQSWRQAACSLREPACAKHSSGSQLTPTYKRVNLGIFTDGKDRPHARERSEAVSQRARQGRRAKHTLPTEDKEVLHVRLKLHITSRLLREPELGRHGAQL